jgi:uncharacterized membrane protein YphA (DoxX/SURF4 family)
MSRKTISPVGSLVLALLRIAIGWQLLYAGLAKLMAKGWTARAFLEGSTGPLGEFFHRLAGNASAMTVVDQANIWGLMFIGGCLMLGLFTRLACVGGMAMLGLYYVAYPPLSGVRVPGAEEGAYLIVSKNLVEMLAMLVIIVFPTKTLGLDAIISAMFRRSPKPVTAAAGAQEPVVDDRVLPRRSLIAGLAGLPFAGAFAYTLMKRRGAISFEEKALAGKKIDVVSRASYTYDFSASLKDLKGTLPRAKIGNLELSRMMLGGNLIGGWAHARDLIYVSKLVKAYHNREKVFETFQLAEAAGINAFLTNPALIGQVQDYWKTRGGKIKFISDCGDADLMTGVKKSIDAGASACYIIGEITDRIVPQGKFDLIQQALDEIRKAGLPAGIGAHKLFSVQACVEKGIRPDFWMKTLHDINYWSAKPQEKCDNIWCEDPAQTIAFMQEQPQPWIAFKVLAAGALHPQQAFRYAFQNGADFICVGMYDFQIIEDVNYAVEVLKNPVQRERKWLV